MIRLNLCYEMYAYSIIFGGQPSYNIFSQNVVTFFYPRILIIMVPQIQVRNIRQLTAQFLGQMWIILSVFFFDLFEIYKLAFTPFTTYF